MVLVFTGCEKKDTISMPFDVADVNNIETVSYTPLDVYKRQDHLLCGSCKVRQTEISGGETGLFYMSRYWRSLG